MSALLCNRKYSVVFVDDRWFCHSSEIFNCRQLWVSSILLWKTYTCACSTRTYRTQLWYRSWKVSNFRPLNSEKLRLKNELKIVLLNGKYICSIYLVHNVFLSIVVAAKCLQYLYLLLISAIHNSHVFNPVLGSFLSWIILFIKY